MPLKRPVITLFVVAIARMTRQNENSVGAFAECLEDELEDRRARCTSPGLYLRWADRAFAKHRPCLRRHTNTSCTENLRSSVRTIRVSVQSALSLEHGLDFRGDLVVSEVSALNRPCRAGGNAGSASVAEQRIHGRFRSQGRN